MTRGGAMIAVAATVVAGCKSPDIQPQQPESRIAVERGQVAVSRLGCGACHRLPHIDWPAGTVGPDLNDFAARALIAGRLPNRPDVLAKFVREAPALVPGTAMPAIPMSDRDAEDIAAYLQANR